MKRWTGCLCVCATMLAVGCGGGDNNDAGNNDTMNTGGNNNNNNTADDNADANNTTDDNADANNTTDDNADANNTTDDNADANNTGGNNDPELDMGPDVTEDMGMDMGSANEEDMKIPTVGDLGNNNGNNNNDDCDEAQKLVDQWPMPGSVATTSIMASESDGVWTATIDASAGGFMGASMNPFIYLDLDTGQKVDVGGKPALTGPVDWDIAFRRTATFLNSGDMAAGSVEITRLTGTSFDAVTAADVPADGDFIQEDAIEDGACIVYMPPSGFGTVETVFNRMNMDTNSGSWFSYGMGDLGGVSVIEDHVYIIRSTDQGKTYKFAFESWDSGIYEVRWAELN